MQGEWRTTNAHFAQYIEKRYRHTFPICGSGIRALVRIFNDFYVWGLVGKFMRVPTKFFLVVASHRWRPRYACWSSATTGDVTQCTENEQSIEYSHFYAVDNWRWIHFATHKTVVSHTHTQIALWLHALHFTRKSDDENAKQNGEKRKIVCASDLLFLFSTFLCSFFASK